MKTPAHLAMRVAVLLMFGVLSSCGGGGAFEELFVKLIVARFVPASLSLAPGSSSTVDFEVTCDRSGLNTPFGRLGVRVKMDPNHLLPAGVTATIAGTADREGFYLLPCATATGDANLKIAHVPVQMTASAATASSTFNLVGYVEIEPLIAGEPSKDSTLAELSITVTAASDSGAVLTINVSGSGRVVSAPAGISCVGTRSCSATFPKNQSVTLSVTPDPGQTFGGFGGDPDCSDGNLTLSANTTCSATFVPTAGRWLQDGVALNVTALTTAASITTPEIEMGSDGQPVAAFVEGSGEHSVLVVRRWDNTSSMWVTIGTPLGSQVSSSSLTIDIGGAPVVAWDEIDASVSNGSHNVFAARWNGTMWVTLGGVPVDVQSTADAHSPSIRAGSENIVLAWVEASSSGGSRIVVRTWNGAAWINVGSTQGPAQPATFPESDLSKLAVGAGNELAVAWSEDSLRIQVAELIGGVWTTTATAPLPAATSGAAFMVDLAFSTTEGLLFVAQQNNGGTFNVRRWRAGAWSDLGTPRGDSGIAGGVGIFGLAFSHGRTGATPLLAYSRRNRSSSVHEFIVERYGSTDWAGVGSAIPTLDRHGHPGFEFSVAVVDAPIPRLATQVIGSLPSSSSRDDSLIAYRFQ